MGNLGSAQLLLLLAIFGLHSVVATRLSDGELSDEADTFRNVCSVDESQEVYFGGAISREIFKSYEVSSLSYCRSGPRVLSHSSLANTGSQV
jgi:hypothetical protein